MLNAFHSADYAKVMPVFNAARNRWEIPDSRVQRMVCLFDTEAQALADKAIALQQLIDREKREAETEAARIKAEQERAAYLASFRGFLSANPMRAGRQMQTLEKGLVFRGEVMTRKAIVETLVAEGRFLTEDGLQRADGTFAVIGKTERAYAAHLIALRDGESVK